MMCRLLILSPCLWLAAGLALGGPPLPQEPNTWVKRSPVKGGPVSPGMGYETSLGYDPARHRVVRWGGHNQGGGGEQNAELWVLDPLTLKWELKEPNRSPPGVCCAQQNVFDPALGRFLRFPAFSGNHGWHWFRENYLSNTAVWNFDLAANTWRDLRPAPAPRLAPLRCASWDSRYQVALVFGGEGSPEGTLVYDPYTNTWTRRRPQTQPAPRSGGNLAYDAGRKVHILFGSQFSDDPHTWAYDLGRDEWRDLKPADQPPASRNDAVLAYDAAHQVVVAVVRVVDRQSGNEIVGGHLETWAYDAGKNTWKRRNPPREPDGWGNRRRVLVAVPDQQVLLMEVFVTPSERVPGVAREQQVWTYRYGPVVPAAVPPAPTGLRVATEPGGRAVLTWKPADGATAYRVCRGAGPVPWEAEPKAVATVRAPETTWRDDGLRPGTVYHYLVRAVDAKGRESDASIRVRTQPRLVEDAVASVVSPREVRIVWRPPPGPDVVGYHVERAVVEVFSEDEVRRLKQDTPPLADPSVGALRAVGPFTRLTKAPIQATAYTDKAVDLRTPRPVDGRPTFTHRFRGDQLDPRGKPYGHAVYAYRIRAVNHLGVEGGPSPYVLTIPSAPQWLFAREEGTRCHLKWAANPETGLKGYRVYRMEGPRQNGPGQKVTRLTAEPLPQPHYTDAGAGRGAHRYWVVAVDALGQEGFPSAPAWHYREYQRYYRPFVGDWHQ
jgi:hypothetical protein